MGHLIKSHLEEEDNWNTQRVSLILLRSLPKSPLDIFHTGWNQDPLSGEGGECLSQPQLIGGLEKEGKSFKGRKVPGGAEKD